MKPHALVTNDDGIDSIFLHRLVDALLPDFTVSVAAPAFEQSWIGRAVTRHGEIEVIQSPSSLPHRRGGMGYQWHAERLRQHRTRQSTAATTRHCPVWHQHWLQHHRDANPQFRNRGWRDRRRTVESARDCV